MSRDSFTRQQAINTAKLQRATHVVCNQYDTLTFYRPSSLSDAYRESGITPSIGQWARLTFYHFGADEFTTVLKWELTSILPEGAEAIQ